MCIPIPYYLSNSFVGIQASQRVRKAGSGINEPPKWEILPPHVFKDSSELPKICEDADVKPSPQDAAANIAKQDKGGDAEPKDEAGTAQAGVAGPAGHYKVGTNIPLIQDNDAARISPAILFPTQWDRKEKSTGLEISPSGLRVTYAGSYLS